MVSSYIGLFRYHPFLIVSWLLSLMGIAMVMTSSWLLFILDIGLFLLIYLLNALERLIAWKKMFLLFILLALIGTPLFNHRGKIVLFYFLSSSITLESLLLGVRIALSSVGLFSLAIIWNTLVTPEKLMRVLEPINSDFKMIVVLGLRFMPKLEKSYRDLHEVQTLKRRYKRNSSFKERIVEGMEELQSLFSFNFESGIQTADAMVSRGYGSGKRKIYDRRPFRLKEGLLLLGVILTLILGIGLKQDVLFLILVLVPIVIQEKEGLR